MENDCHHSASALQLMWNQSATGPEILLVRLMLTHSEISIVPSNRLSRSGKNPEKRAQVSLDEGKQ